MLSDFDSWERQLAQDSVVSATVTLADENLQDELFPIHKSIVSIVLSGPFSLAGALHCLLLTWFGKCCPFCLDALNIFHLELPYIELSSYRFLWRF